jgi:hypothetical protein
MSGSDLAASAATPGRAAVVAGRLAARFGAAGAAHPALAAAVVVARGRRMLDPVAFAALVGVPVTHLRSWESGRRPPVAVPRRLRQLAPELDWDTAGVTQPGDPADPASRHPAAGSDGRAVIAVRPVAARRAAAGRAGSALDVPAVRA